MEGDSRPSDMSLVSDAVAASLCRNELVQLAVESCVALSGGRLLGLPLPSPSPFDRADRHTMLQESRDVASYVVSKGSAAARKLRLTPS